MEKHEAVKLAKLESDVMHIKETATRIEKALEGHVNWELKKYDDMDERFACKNLEAEVVILDKELADLPYKMRKLFANIWTETYLKSVTAIVAGSFIIFAMTKILN